MNNKSLRLSHNQYDFTRRVVDAAQEILVLPSVVESLGIKGVYLTLAMDSVRARPTNNGEIEWAEDDSRTTIHTVSLSPDQSIRIPQTGSNEHQYAFGTDLFGDEVAYQLLLDRDTPVSLTMDNNLAGIMVASTRIRALPDSAKFPLQMYIRGRPTIALRYEETADLRSQALIMLHELDHAMNATIYPIHLSRSDDDYHLRNELSAYGTQSTIARAIGVKKETYLAHVVERIRKDCNGHILSDDAYRTDSGVVERLREAGLGDIHE